MKITKRFYEQAQKAAHLIYVGHYYPTIDDAYKSGGSAEKRNAFYNLYYRFIELEKQRKINIQRMGIVSANINIFTFACLFIDRKTGVLKCYYTTPYNDITIDYGTSWEDFKREQKCKGL